MSKGRVWNKGKRNGGGGPAEGSKELAEAKARKSGVLPQEEVRSDVEDKAANPIDQVGRMNRENWVVRPTRVKPPEKQE
ncbi:hypothetical protein EHS13_03260 [Paenibacillus psychroresistens]|uniref:Uncharacterized protein n=1 Tax=Paenibacillus psychroresistens TaxID=1778678 RepID=A0A6B8RE45_9BACL|nr:hypothetical protein [Paenibacillus psychroresistens]QGQ93994.1 hypothetical protein EHS13_03260 [Paenibacillus psychroresistens]